MQPQRITNRTRRAGFNQCGLFACYADRMIEDADTTLLALLDEKIAYHRGQTKHHSAEMERHRSELARYESSAAPLRGESPTVQGVVPREKKHRSRATAGTSFAIERVLGESGRPLLVAELTQALLASGWETASADPVNNVRTQVNRAVATERVRKTSDGRYTLAGRED